VLIGHTSLENQGTERRFALDRSLARGLEVNFPAHPTRKRAV